MDPNPLPPRHHPRIHRFPSPLPHPNHNQFNTLPPAGLIKSTVSTTATQVLTRVIQVWIIWFCYPHSTAQSHAYPALVFAWATADAVRYAYLAANMWGRAPAWLKWLRYVSFFWPFCTIGQSRFLLTNGGGKNRYTVFYPLYPVGIGAEWWLFFLAVEPAAKMGAVVSVVFWACLVAYGPGSYVMYTYMIRQRRKMLGGGRREA
ncbi:tyrosine phosphatase-like protein [Phaeosphaeriaceae sp. PMI808]|nr:tyrosine phosphatase-like protein [Phaeosphaeriaceae sp. PMI808]